VKVLVTGAGGMLGRDVVLAAGNAAGALMHWRLQLCSAAK
jgi:nucleoside-diphosphate-sugar epimerase